MLIELLSTDNYVSYNIKVAQLLGLHAAIYLSELMNINDKAIRKKKVTENTFKLDRKYIASRTTLSEKEQLDIETNLLKLGILKKGETKDDLSLNLTVLTSLLMSQDEKLLENISKLTDLKTSKPKKTKAEAVRDELKKYIETNNEELREAYCDWIDAVYARQGWMSKKSVIHAQRTIDEFTGRDLDIALKLLELASINGHRDIDWTIDLYKKQHVVNYKVFSFNPGKTQKETVKVSDEVF